MRVSSNLGILIIISDDECSYTLIIYINFNYVYTNPDKGSCLTD